MLLLKIQVLLTVTFKISAIKRSVETEETMIREIPSSIKIGVKNILGANC